jgi:hypothetical protein
MWQKIPKCILKSALLALAVVILFIFVLTVVVWSSGDTDYQGKLIDPFGSYRSTSKTDTTVKQQIISTIPQYSKGEEQTYLTLPEWYLVFNPNEYAHYLNSGGNPSNFPFFASIDEYWRLYDRVIHLTNDVYPENSEYKTMLLVIGVSTTAEFLIKGLYETTIGRFSYWTASEPTPEDLLIRQAHTAYGELIYHEPWYVFPFSKWLKKIWTDTPFFGSNFIRKIERKFLFTLEFGFKTIYAQLIGFGAKTAYDASDGRVKMHVFAPQKLDSISIKEIDERVSVLHEFNNGEWIISIPRWGGFTEIMPKLASYEIQFIEIAGNDDILVTVILDEGKPAQLSGAQFLFNSMIISPNGKQRLLYSIKMAELAGIINEFDEHGLVLEHLYDY